MKRRAMPCPWNGRRVAMVAAGVLGIALPASAADPAQVAATVCAACHDADGNGSLPGAPKLAGLQAWYLAKQLKDYVAGRRKSDLMGPVATMLSDDDAAGLAAHFAKLPPQPGKASDPALAARGRVLYDDGDVERGVPACVGCHQEGGLGNERNPRLAGQPQAYTIEQLNQFRKNLRTNDRIKAMRTVAERMSDDEMRAVAEYLAGL